MIPSSVIRRRKSKKHITMQGLSENGQNET